MSVLWYTCTGQLILYEKEATMPVITNTKNDIFWEVVPVEDIPHGEWFDDDSRWCHTCQLTKFMCEAVETNVWSEKTCHTCFSLWPEYFTEFGSFLQDDDLYENKLAAVLN